MIPPSVTRNHQKPVDNARAADAHSAQLTLISILLGAIVGAVIVGLPPNAHTFVTHLLVNSPSLDVQVLATLIAAIDLWVKYSWGIMIYEWPFTLHHNFVYFLVTFSLIGAALSVGDLRAWIAWSAATLFAAFVAYIRNTFILEPGIRQFISNLVEGSITLVAAVATGLVALGAYGLGHFPQSAANMVAFWWPSAILAFLMLDIGVQFYYMQKQRWIPNHHFDA